MCSDFDFDFDFLENVSDDEYTMHRFKSPPPTNTFCDPGGTHSHMSSGEDDFPTPTLPPSRSTSLPPDRPLKSALANSSSASSPGSETVKHAHFDDQYLETEAPPRRSATDPWPFQRNVTALNLRSLSAPTAAAPIVYTDDENELFDKSP